MTAAFADVEVMGEGSAGVADSVVAGGRKIAPLMLLLLRVCDVNRPSFTVKSCTRTNGIHIVKQGTQNEILRERAMA